VTAPDAQPVLDVIAEVVLPEVGNRCSCTMFGGKHHNVNPPCATVRAAHDLADAVLAACQGATLGQQAELTDGEVKRRDSTGLHEHRVVGPWRKDPS
jgi:hypothetical protein